MLLRNFIIPMQTFRGETHERAEHPPQEEPVSLSDARALGTERGERQEYELHRILGILRSLPGEYSARDIFRHEGRHRHSSGDGLQGWLARPFRSSHAGFLR